MEFGSGVIREFETNFDPRHAGPNLDRWPFRSIGRFQNVQQPSPMSRLKILLEDSRNVRGRTVEPREFYFHLNEMLRKVSGGSEWAVQGALERNGHPNDLDRGQPERVYLCEISDLDDRWPLVKELMQEYEIETETAVYHEEALHAGWERIWPRVEEAT